MRAPVFSNMKCALKSVSILRTVTVVPKMTSARSSRRQSPIKVLLTTSHTDEQILSREITPVLKEISILHDC